MARCKPGARWESLRVKKVAVFGNAGAGKSTLARGFGKSHAPPSLPIGHDPISRRWGQGPAR